MKQASTPEGLRLIYGVRERLLAETGAAIGQRIRAVMQLKGFGAAGASGLLALLYPQEFGTVDRYVVIALRRVTGLAEAEILECMDESDLRASDAVQLIRIFRRKAANLNAAFESTVWTPRKIDMVLWAIDRGR